MVKKTARHPGIYLLPNLLTTCSLFAAFYSIVASFKGVFDMAAVAIFVGLIADGLDGRIARLTNTQTDFGAEYDSLSDMVTFGVAPSILMYSWILQHLGQFGGMLAFIYTVAVALRLARFNTQLETADKNYFQGLACPAAASVLCSYVWVCQAECEYLKIPFIAITLVLIMAMLMVSNIRYSSFKDLGTKGRIRFLHVLISVGVFVAIASNPAITLFIISFVYACSGPWQTLLSLHKVRKQRRQGVRRKKRTSIPLP